MKSKLSLLVAGLALALITVVQAAGADVSGKWTAQVPGRAPGAIRRERKRMRDPWTSDAISANRYGRW